MDNIVIKRTWRDDDFFELEVMAKSEKICATTNFYTDNSRMTNLSKGLELFSEKSKNEFYWENIEYADGPVNLSFRVSTKDNLGHILIEIYMLIKDYCDDGKHNCCFYIETEIGLINMFGKRIARIEKLLWDECISLLPNE